MAKFELQEKETQKKRFYFKWPWNLVVYIVLVVVLRIFAIPTLNVADYDRGPPRSGPRNNSLPKTLVGGAR